MMRFLPHVLTHDSGAIMYELWLVGLALAKLGPRLKEHDIVTALVLDRYDMSRFFAATDFP